MRFVIAKFEVFSFNFKVTLRSLKIPTDTKLWTFFSISSPVHSSPTILPIYLKSHLGKYSPLLKTTHREKDKPYLNS